MKTYLYPISLGEVDWLSYTANVYEYFTDKQIHLFGFRKDQESKLFFYLFSFYLS